MRRSICYCEPLYVRTGDKNTWKFIYSPASDLPKNSSLCFFLNSEGNEFDWQIPDCAPKAKKNAIWAELSKEKKIFPKEIHPANTLCPYFEFILPSPLKAGEKITFYLGSSDKKSQENGNRCQLFVQRRRTFVLTIDPKIKGKPPETEAFHLDVRGNHLKTLRIIVPSFVSRNRRFDVIVRFEDEYKNLTSYAPEGTLIELTYENLRENLCWRLFVPETGFLTLPNLYFNEPGIYKIRLKNLTSHETFFSPPIQCLPESDLSIFWGSLHEELEQFDASQNIENYLRHIRDEKAYQFISTSPFDNEEETSNEMWKHISQNISEFNEEDRFISFLGFQWTGNPSEEGQRHFIYSKDLRPLLRKKDMKHNSLKKIYKIYQPKELLSIPFFTIWKNHSYNFADFNPDFESVVEIYNAWGSSECLTKEGNLFPIMKMGAKTADESPEGSIREALNKNCRFGFVAGGLDDRGIYSDFFDSDQIQYSPGLTAIITTTHSREALFDALHRRSCFATTGAKIVLNFEVAQSPMGSEINTHRKPGLFYVRHLSGYVLGTAPIEKVEIIRNGKIFQTFEPQKDEYIFEIDDTDLLQTVSLPSSKPQQHPFVYYYLRAIQQDGHVAWSSPIWVDWIESPKKEKKEK